MRQIASIGEALAGVTYTDRPTVKVVIHHDDKILILNNGLLPGGGVDAGETLQDAIGRELQEELGAVVNNIEEIGLVEQFRPFLEKRYLVYGYTAELVEFTGNLNPQNEGEANFVPYWVTKDEAVNITSASIKELTASTPSFDSDATQGKLHNLMTSYKIIKASTN